MSTKEKIQEDVDVLEQETHQHEIVLHNDDVNTFDHVIDSLIDVCDHSLEQAEQCATLVHYKGKCTVKSGEYKYL
jgi:ATP-dependent Clp protease adaptor protein ClpS